MSNALRTPLLIGAAVLAAGAASVPAASAATPDTKPTTLVDGAAITLPSTGSGRRSEARLLLRYERSRGAGAGLTMGGGTTFGTIHRLPVSRGGSPRTHCFTVSARRIAGFGTTVAIRDPDGAPRRTLRVVRGSGDGWRQIRQQARRLGCSPLTTAERRAGIRMVTGTTYVHQYKRPHVFTGTVFAGDRFRVTGHDGSHWCLGRAYGHVNRAAAIRCSALASR